MNRPGPYVCLDAGYFDDEKVAACHCAAVALHVACLCFAARELTDGRIPGVIMRRLMHATRTRKRDLDRLIEVGLVDTLGKVPGSPMADDYYLPAYLGWNPSKAELEESRERNRQRQATYRDRKQGEKHLRAV